MITDGSSSKTSVLAVRAAAVLLGAISFFIPILPIAFWAYTMDQYSASLRFKMILATSLAYLVFIGAALNGLGDIDKGTKASLGEYLMLIIGAGLLLAPYIYTFVRPNNS